MLKVAGKGGDLSRGSLNGLECKIKIGDRIVMSVGI